MDFLRAEVQVRSKRAYPLVSFVAVPNGHYALLWKQINVKPEDDAWDTQSGNFNVEQIGHILRTWATLFCLAKHTTSIRLLLNSLIHIDGDANLQGTSVTNKPRPIDRKYPPYMA